MPANIISPPQGQFLLERVSPAIRYLLVKERVRAMGGRAEVALRSISDAIRLVSHDRPRDVVALGLLKAEILHLDLMHDEALAEMKTIVTPHLSSLTTEERFGVEQNLSDLQFSSTAPDDALFYNVVDQKRLLNFEWLDYRDLFSAKQDAERGKHFDTLPILWQQLRRAYLHGCWVAMRWTSGLFARECINLKEWEDAVHHAIMAYDDTLLGDIAEGVLASRRPELVDRVVNRLVTTANLKNHFVVACKLISSLAEGIPDVWIPKLGQWLLKRATEIPTGPFGPNHYSAAWKTIATIASRFPSDLARSAIAIATDHLVWTTKLDNPDGVITERREVVRAIGPLAWALTPEDIPPLAEAALQLLTDRRQISDYNDVVNLVCNLAVRGGPAVRDSLATSLYPSGQPVSRVLTQVANVFGKSELFDPIRLRQLAHQVTQEIRRQVQWLGPEQIAQPVAEQIMEFTSPRSDRTLKVYVAGLSGLHALARHQAKLDETALGLLLDAIVEMACNKDNFCANRQSLLHALVEFAEAVPCGKISDIEAALESLARGPVEESSEYPTAEETANPLNPFKHNSGRPEDVQSMALVALAALASGHPAFAKRIGDLLEDALCDYRPGIRQAGYAAAKRIPDVSEGVILSVLSGLRDPDPNAAVSAFAAFAQQTNWKLNRNHWRVFLMAVTLAQRTGSPHLREHAAAAIVAWSPKCPAQFTSEQTNLITEFRNDVCWSVRMQTKHMSENGK